MWSIKERIKAYIDFQVGRQLMVLGKRIDEETNGLVRRIDEQPNLLGKETPTESCVDQPVLFGSSYIHLSDPHVRKHYNALFRGYEEELEYKKLISSIRDYTMVTYDGLVSLCDIVRYCEQSAMPGDFAEAGVWKGGATALMSLVSAKYGTKPRTIHAFDSFVGLPEPMGAKDFDERYLNIEDTFRISKEESTGKLRPINALCAAIENFIEVVNAAGHPLEKLKVYKGWFQHTMPNAADKMDELAILRLDGDLYDSYRVSLEYLYPKVRTGGFVIIDDWCIGGCRKAVTEYFVERGGMPFMSTVDITGRYFIKP